GVLVDLGSAAEFTPDNNRNVLIEATEMEVFNQRRKSHIKLGDASAAGSEILAVGVPAAKRDRHHPRPGFNQAPGHQEMVHAARWTVRLVAHVANAVALAKPRIFLGEIECFEYPARRQDLECSLGKAVHSVHRLVAVERAAEAV